MPSFAQGVLCNCTLHLANLGDCRAVGAFRTVLSPQTTWIGPPKQPPTKTKKQKVRIPYASSWTGQPMAAMAQRPSLSNLKSVISHDQPFDIGSLSFTTSVDMKVSTYHYTAEVFNLLPSLGQLRWYCGRCLGRCLGGPSSEQGLMMMMMMPGGRDIQNKSNGVLFAMVTCERYPLVWAIQFEHF